MNNEKEGKAEIIKQLFSGIAKILPFFERMSMKSPSQLLGFLKCIIVFFTMIILFLCALFWAFSSNVVAFIPLVLTTILVLFAITIFTVWYTTRLKMKEMG